MSQYKISKKISIKRKPVPTLPGLTEDMRTRKLGSGVTKPPLTELEKIKYMPTLVGVAHDAANFEEACRNYFANISVPVPSNEEGDGKGLVLEIGFEYKDETSFKSKDISINSKNIKDGTFPLSVQDYVLWKHCLVYGRVAKDYKDAGKSPKIMFYMQDDEVIKKAKLIKSKNTTTAMAKAAGILGDTIKKKYIVSVATQMLNSNEFDTIKPLDQLDDDDLDLLILAELAPKHPLMFIEITQDKELEFKFLLTMAINKGIVKRLSNGSTLVYESKTGQTILGSDLQEAIITLRKDEKGVLFTEIKSELVLKYGVKEVSNIKLHTATVATNEATVTTKL